MNVLITGGVGFIGAATGAHLTDAGHKVTLFDHRHGYDILDRRFLFTVFENHDAVINLAGVLGTSETIGAEQEAVSVNVLGAVNVFDAARAAGIPVVQIGTGHRGQLNPYAITKACAEDLAMSRAQWTGQEIAVVRAFHVYGPGQKAPPPHGTSTVRKIVPSFVCRALSGMPLEINGDGAQLIDLVHVDDVARVLADAIGGPYGEVLDAGTGVATSVLDCARDVIALCDSPSDIVHLPMRKGEPDWSTVIAKSPLIGNVWPYRLAETVAAYRDLLAVAA